MLRKALHISNLHVFVFVPFLMPGGGILEIEMEDILQVDGFIKANSLDIGVTSDLAGASGGSGGSILIHTGAFTGENHSIG